MLLKGKAAIITGSARGIGKQCLESFAEQGADVFACARKKTDEFEEFCQKLAEEKEVMIRTVYFDFMMEDEIKNAIKEIGSITKDIDILVNNAGMVGNINLFQMTPVRMMREEFEVNFFGPMLFTQYISKWMGRKKKGSIVNISSVAGLDGNTGTLQYVSSKAAVIAATKSLAIELGKAGIRVNSVAPGLTDTDMGNMMSDNLEQETLSHQIFARKAKTEEIASAVVFLASDMASFITGQTLRVDGGMLK